MPSLSDKRLVHFTNKYNQHANTELGNINVNTDELETKMDSVIVNTNHNQYSGSLSSVVGGSATIVSIASTDLGNSSAIHKLQVVGTTTHSNIDNVIQVSSNNSDWFDLTTFIITVTGTKFSGCGDILFRYFRMNTTNNTAGDVTVNIEHSAKNLN